MSASQLPAFATEFIKLFINEQKDKYLLHSGEFISSAVNDFVKSNQTVITNNVLEQLKKVKVDFKMPTCHPIVHGSMNTVSESITQYLQKRMSDYVTDAVSTYESEIIKKMQLVLETEVRALLVEKMTNIFSPDHLTSLLSGDTYNSIINSCIDSHKDSFTQRISDIVLNFETSDNDYIRKDDVDAASHTANLGDASHLTATDDTISDKESTETWKPESVTFK